jgi:hypothetical protein
LALSFLFFCNLDTVEKNKKIKKDIALIPHAMNLNKKVNSITLSTQQKWHMANTKKTGKNAFQLLKGIFLYMICKH